MNITHDIISQSIPKAVKELMEFLGHITECDVALVGGAVRDLAMGSAINYIQDWDVYVQVPPSILDDSEEFIENIRSTLHNTYLNVSTIKVDDYDNSSFKCMHIAVFSTKRGSIIREECNPTTQAVEFRALPDLQVDIIIGTESAAERAKWHDYDLVQALWKPNYISASAGFYKGLANKKLQISAASNSKRFSSAINAAVRNRLNFELFEIEVDHRTFVATPKITPVFSWFRDLCIFANRTWEAGYGLTVRSHNSWYYPEGTCPSLERVIEYNTYHANNIHLEARVGK